MGPRRADAVDDPTPDPELLRLRSLFALDLVSGGVDERFARWSRLAALSLGVPFALVTLVDDERQFLCGSHGAGDGVHGIDREQTFCSRLVDERPEIMVIEDTLADERFRELDVVVGEPHVRFYAGVPITAPDGQVLGTLCVLDVRPRGLSGVEREILRDLASSVEDDLGTVALATTDDLTGLSNRRGFDAVAERFTALARRRRQAVSVVFVDVDGLKRINDDRGHAAGDELLRASASVLTSSVRSCDLVARVGGDEFGIVAFGLDDHECQRLVARVLDAVTARNLERPADALLSLSCGGATRRRGESSDALVARADAAMYAARRAVRAGCGA